MSSRKPTKVRMKGRRKPNVYAKMRQRGAAGRIYQLHPKETRAEWEPRIRKVCGITEHPSRRGVAAGSTGASAPQQGEMQ